MVIPVHFSLHKSKVFLAWISYQSSYKLICFAQINFQLEFLSVRNETKQQKMQRNSQKRQEIVELFPGLNDFYGLTNVEKNYHYWEHNAKIKCAQSGLFFLFVLFSLRVLWLLFFIITASFLFGLFRRICFCLWWCFILFVFVIFFVIIICSSIAVVLLLLVLVVIYFIDIFQDINVAIHEPDDDRSQTENNETA